MSFTGGVTRLAEIESSKLRSFPASPPREYNLWLYSKKYFDFGNNQAQTVLDKITPLDMKVVGLQLDLESALNENANLTTHLNKKVSQGKTTFLFKASRKWKIKIVNL